LMSLSDDLIKADLYVEQATRKIARQWYDIQEKAENLTVNGTNIETYLTHFEWEEAKYPVKSPLKVLTEQIQSQVGKIDEELRGKSGEYNAISHSIAAAERKAVGNLMVKDLSDIVKKDQLPESEYLTTLLVIVPKYLEKDWHKTYETLTNFVLPRSSVLIDCDNDFCLYTVTLFKRWVDNFKNSAREKRFTVRDFKFSESGATGKEEKKKLDDERDRLRQNLIRWCKTNFAETYMGWIHLKAVRVFVESVLRYGLPARFQAMLVLPNKKKDIPLRKVLATTFALGGVGVDAADDDVSSNERFYPYVSLNINLDMH